MACDCHIGPHSSGWLCNEMQHQSVRSNSKAKKIVCGLVTCSWLKKKKKIVSELKKYMISSMSVKIH